MFCFHLTYLLQSNQYNFNKIVEHFENLRLQEVQLCFNDSVVDSLTSETV